MSNLFSSFDPTILLFGIKFSLNWLSLFIPVLIIPQTFWVIRSQFLKRFENIITYLIIELSAVFGPMGMSGTIFIFLRFFFFILFSNLMGLLPYVFTGSRHIVFTLSFALPIWLGSILWSIKNQYNNIFAHLVPIGTPGLLIPVIVLIETVRNIIRPGTLSIRLAANMVAGHLLLTLLGSQGIILTTPYLLVLIVGLVLLLCLELAVACIQAYVFTILRSLYLNELCGTLFNKRML